MGCVHKCGNGGRLIKFIFTPLFELIFTLIVQSFVLTSRIGCYRESERDSCMVREHVERWKDKMIGCLGLQSVD